MKRYISGVEKFSLRETTEKDIALIIDFIKEIATYEKLLDQVTVNEERIKKFVFDKRRAEILIAEFDDKPIGYVVYFYNFSTFTGTSGLYLEDIYFSTAYRGRGFGKEVFKILSEIAKEEGCKRMEWVCLKWNIPSKNFYKSLGAIEMDEWSTFRLTEKYINNL